MIERQKPARAFLVTAWLFGAASFATGQVLPENGIEFVTIGAPGNAPYHPPDVGPLPSDLPQLREPVGSVNYEYRIARMETTTGEWMRFMNTFSVQIPRFGPHPYSSIFHLGPFPWGAGIDTSYTGPGERWTLRTPDDSAALWPVLGISWRAAAIYCNWLHNGQQSTFESLMNGAYDVSTFTGDALNGYADQPTRSPGARFWIPSMDEWTKAAHFDPDRYGAGQPGYWLYPTRSDTAPVYGPPSAGGEANADFLDDQNTQWRVPLGAYASITSPWGLFDAAGAAREWTEMFDFRSLTPSGLPSARATRGSFAGSFAATNYDRIFEFGMASPDSDDGLSTLRIASAVPAPSHALPIVGVALVAHRRRRPGRS